MDINLKPFLGARASKISYKEPGLFDLNQTRSNLLALLAKLRSYLTSSGFQTRVTTLNNLTHQAIKQNIHETLNALIETYVSQSTQEKIEECLNSLSKTSLTEEDRNNITAFYQRLGTNILDPISNILELLQISESAGHILEGDSESAEVRARKILLGIIYNIHVTKQRPLNTLAKYCHINHQNLLNALTRESQPLSQNDFVESTDFSLDKFKGDYLTSNEEVDRVAQLFDQAVTTKSARELLDILKNTISSPEFNAEYALTDANVKLDYIQDLNREELKTTLRRSLEGLLRDQVEEKSTTLLHSLEAHLKEIRDEFSKLKDYFQARDESKTHQKLINGSYENDLVETQNHEATKELHTIKIYEDLMVEIFSNLSELEKANGKYSETTEYISGEVKKLFSELLENARKSFAVNTPPGAFKEDLLLDETPFLNSLHELIEKVNPDPSKLTEKINLNAVQEKLGLTAKEIEDENILKNSNLTGEMFDAHRQQPTPFYFYNITSQVLILQVFDLANNSARIFSERKEELENNNIPSSVQKVHLIINQDLKRTLELLVECYNLKTNKSQNINDATIRSILLTLSLFIIDAYIGEDVHVNEIVIEKRHIQEFIAAQKSKKQRKTPTEQPQVEENYAPVEVNPQVEENQAEKTETIEEQPPAEEPKPEQVEESKETEETNKNPEQEAEETNANTEQEVQQNVNEEAAAEEKPVASEEAGNVEVTAETQETQQDTNVSNVENQTQEEKPQEVPEEAKTEEPQTEDTSAKNAGDEDQEEGGKEEPQGGNKEGGQAAGGASKNKKKKKKR